MFFVRCQVCSFPLSHPGFQEKLYGLSNPQGNHGEDVKGAGNQESEVSVRWFLKMFLQILWKDHEFIKHYDINSWRFLQRIRCMVMMCFGRRSCTTIWTQLQHIATWRWCTNIPRPAQQCDFGPAWPWPSTREGWVSIRRAEKGSTLKERRTLCFWISPASRPVNHSKSPWQPPWQSPWSSLILDPCESQGVWVAGHRDFRWQSILWCRDRAPALAWTRRERTRAEHGRKMGTFPTISAGMPRQIRMILSQLP